MASTTDIHTSSAGLRWAGATVVTVAAIVAAVVLIGVLAPDLVSGSEQQHLPIAALVASLWGAGAIIAVVVAMARLRPAGHSTWTALAATTSVGWAAATLLAVLGPTVETGSDPTVIPIAAVLAPMGATFVTVVAGVVFAVAGSPRSVSNA